LTRNCRPARMARADTGDRNALGPLESLFRLYAYEPTARSVNGGNDQEARSPALGPSRSNGKPVFLAVRNCRPPSGVSSSRPFGTSTAPRLNPAAAEKSNRFSSTVTRAAGGPSKGAYCWRDERQSAVTAANQFWSNRRVASMPMRPRRTESVYDCSLLRSPPRLAVTVQGVAIRGCATTRPPAPVSAGGSMEPLPAGPPLWNAASTTGPGRGSTTATPIPALTAAGAGSSMTTACGSSGAPL